MQADLHDVVDAVVDVSDRVVSVMRRADDPAAPAVGHWSVADVACHLAHTFERNVDGALGRGFPGEDIDTIAEYNDAYLRLDPERDLKVLAEKIEHQTAEFLAATRDRKSNQLVPWFGGRMVPVATIAGVVLSECEIHGLDMAQGAGLPWELPRSHAALVFDSQLPLLHWFVDAEAAKGFDACFDMRLAGAQRAHLVFVDGELKVSPPARRRVDCHIRADPAAFLLMSYGRVGKWAPLLTGKVVAYGRKPWLGLKLQKVLKAP